MKTSSVLTFLLLFMPALNKKTGTVNNEKTGDYCSKKRDLVADGLHLTGRPYHPYKHIPRWPDKKKGSIPEFFKTVFHLVLSVCSINNRPGSDLTINPKFTFVEFFKDNSGQILQCVDHIGKICQKYFPDKHMFGIPKEGHKKIKKVKLQIYFLKNLPSNYLQ